MMHEFLYLVKNLRGILVLPVTNAADPEPLIKWLGLRFRNRKIGYYLPGARARNREAAEPTSSIALKRLQKQPFVALSLPKELEELVHQFSAPFRPWLTQAFLANLYGSPLILPAATMAETIPAAGIHWSLAVDAELSAADLKFNIRLADYAMTDFLQSLIPGTLAELVPAASAGDLAGLLELRKAAAEGDGNARYCRLLELSPDATGPHLQVMYFDWLPLLADADTWPQWQAFLHQYPEILQRYSQLLNLTIAVGLSVG
ncbi:MAG: hypothetical protein Q9P14_16465 [candidate division KSB1 bacterium]|nr:hypothetical protein [candidate division KSB1 bacterium]